jgi:hypothetical protein
LKKALLIISIFFIASNFSFAQTERVNANKSSILNDTIYLDDLLLKIRRDPKLGTQDVSFQEWEQIKKILESQKKEEISLRDEYFLCFTECKKYLQAKQIGNAIYCANTFEKKYKLLKNDVLLINICNLFVTIYEESNMLDDALKYMRLRYKLQCKNMAYAHQMFYCRFLVWKLYMYGCSKNSPALIQEAQVLGGKRIAFYEKYQKRQVNRKIVISPMIAINAVPVAEALAIEIYSYAEDVEGV